MEKIETNQNVTHHKSIKCSSYEILQKKSLMDPFNSIKQLPNDKINENNNTQTNKKRKATYKYKINDKVYIKNITTKKLDQIWNGPYRITHVDESENRIKYEGNESVWVNIKRIRPDFSGGGNIRCVKPPDKED